jgi:predicted lipoprotein with Yx(FWY)xxD motif
VPLRSRPARTLVVLAVLGLTAACGSDDDGASTTTTRPADESTTTTEPSTTETTEGATAATVEVTESDLGQILTSEGMTLYLFMPDDGGAPTCYDDCATAWPPLVADGAPTVGEGLDAALFATAARDDGGDQLTVDGWPLYFFSGDAAPGDTTGQGVGGQWYAVGPDGVAIDDT